MERLSYRLIESGFNFPEDVTVGKLADMPERVIQFGEGNFLRAFVDWMINETNKQGLFNGKVVIVQPIRQGLVSVLNEQDRLYTVLLRGIRDDKLIERKEIITCVSRGINPYTDYQDFLQCATNSDLRFMISNTTEVGIAYVKEPRPLDQCPASFPAKVTAFLLKRYEYFAGTHDKGMIIVPCELIDRNGDELKSIVLRYADEWGLEPGFGNWIENSNYFLNTLVDRIVTGYPQDEIQELTQKLGYEDRLLDAGEIFHLWVIEGDERFSEELPVTQVGCNVLWTDDVQPYRTRKVRILNGAHTMTALAAFLCGKNTVREFMDDPSIVSYMKRGIFEEIVPALDLPEEEKMQFARDVLERFRNPFIKHLLLSISVNSVSKWRIRLLPSLAEYVARQKKLPTVLTFSLAALIAFYRGTEVKDDVMQGLRDGKSYSIQDEKQVLDHFAEAWKEFDQTPDVAGICGKVLRSEALWGRNLDEVEGLTLGVAAHLSSILSRGMAVALQTLQ